MAIDHVLTVSREAARLVAVARQGPLDARVPGCPGWDVARLTSHVGRVHRWATASIVGRAEPDSIGSGGSRHVHTSDDDSEWTVRTDDGVFQAERGHHKADVALRGPASSVLLVLYRRLRPGDGGTDVIGDAAVLDRWLAL